MYVLKPGVKKDPLRRWQLPDRIFFGYGACHILAGVFLERFQDCGFKAVWIKPNDDLPGNHIFVCKASTAFDFHCYSNADRLIQHHVRAQRHPGWTGNIQDVDFPLLDTPALNARKMRGPDQYLFDPLPRAVKFLDRFKNNGSTSGHGLSLTRWSENLECWSQPGRHPQQEASLEALSKTKDRASQR